MTSREIVRRCIEFREPPRAGGTFLWTLWTECALLLAALELPWATINDGEHGKPREGV